MAGGSSIAFRMKAFAMAMSAKSGAVDVWDVADLEIAAEDQKDPEDPLVRAALTFTSAYDHVANDERGLREAGDRLANAIERATRPDPIDAHRKDIYG
ncbi:MAG: hypothetical protein AAFY81_10420 [Pseudomonadota bacterium]